MVLFQGFGVFFLMPCALVYLAQRLKGHFYFDP